MDAQSLIKEITDYSASRGLKTSTVCQYVFKNPLYLDNLQARLDRLAREADKFRLYAAENPVLAACDCNSTPPVGEKPDQKATP